MNGILIYPKEEAKRNSHAVGFYQSACEKRQIRLQLAYVENFTWGMENSAPFLHYEGKPVKTPDFTIMRAPCPELSAHLESMGHRVFNCARLSRIANDKWETIEIAKSLGIPTPKTALADKKTAASLAAEMGYPLVMKPRDGHGGQDVLWVENEAKLTEILPAFHHKSFLLQTPVSDLGRDKRVYVLGGKPVTAMLRVREDDFRSNYCLGGKAEEKPLSAKEKDYIVRLAKTLPMDFVGVDFLYDGGEPVLGEMEDVVGARMLYHLTDFDIIDDYVVHILRVL